MDEPTATFRFLGLTFDWSIVISTLVSMAIVVAIAVFLSRRPSVRPNKRQNAMEWMLDFSNSIIGGQLPKDLARKFGLYAFTLFFFVIVSNEIGLLLQIKMGDGVTYMKSPTADPIVTMTLSIMTLAIAHGIGVKELGLGGYLKNMLLTPYSWMLPLNIIEQLANFLTLSLRLFGNIFAGEMLLNLIASSMAWPGHFNGFLTILALPLEMIWQGFSLFIGAIQAYVFVILTGVFIAQLSGNE
ncbi:F0F1 ATP synthase subunit A [Convivina praedatoris]|uniref:ATP synthase subunit a n=1 Tax=Convivina praedatoris TaxID=2880963 RepID=A0ABN8H7K9_9LACO|nr:F0F1 ATP synthase subunit A [Convivina sp. LMG 32447]CAH1851519.1 ATP synthase subunit a [Convivina sp. LMG 32447]CAH1851541.1 ATP synthase subunit a [Convivina sp. LMG 32447]CAH1853215.1 ATP synthase subunit a [Convivina sp. LMG 32447]